jgi:hypothetical protein
VAPLTAGGERGSEMARFRRIELFLPKTHRPMTDHGHRRQRCEAARLPGLCADIGETEEKLAEGF